MKKEVVYITSPERRRVSPETSATINQLTSHVRYEIARLKGDTFDLPNVSRPSKDDLSRAGAEMGIDLTSGLDFK